MKDLIPLDEGEAEKLGLEEEEGKEEEEDVESREKTNCVRCGERCDLSLLHPDSLPIPESGDWYATHGPTVCGGDDDLGTWIVEV